MVDHRFTIRFVSGDGGVLVGNTCSAAICIIIVVVVVPRTPSLGMVIVQKNSMHRFQVSSENIPRLGGVLHRATVDQYLEVRCGATVFIHQVVVELRQRVRVARTTVVAVWVRLRCVGVVAAHKKNGTSALRRRTRQH